MTCDALGGSHGVPIGEASLVRDTPTRETRSVQPNDGLPAVDALKGRLWDRVAEHTFGSAAVADTQNTVQNGSRGAVAVGMMMMALLLEEGGR
jgi:hypothetical protein